MSILIRTNKTFKYPNSILFQMKKITFLLLCVSLLFFQCRKERGAFEMPYLTEMEIPAGIPAFPFQNIETGTPIITSANNIFDGNGYTADDIELITARSIKLDVTFPAGSDFAFLQRARLEIRGEDGVVAEIGYLEFIPNNQGGSLDLIPSTTDVTDILKGTYYDVIFKMDPRYSPTQFIRFRLSLIFDAFTAE